MKTRLNLTFFSPFFVALAVALGAVQPAGAVDSTWNGSGGDNNWTTGGNWGGTAPVAVNRLFFDGSTQLNNNNDFATDTLFSNITFKSTAGAFILGGNGLVLGNMNGSVVNGGITNLSANVQTITLGLKYTNSITLTSSTAGLVIGGGLTTAAPNGNSAVNLGGTGTISNNFASIANGTNILSMQNGANWTIVDNTTATPITANLTFSNTANGSIFNYGTASSAPNLTATVADNITAARNVIGGNSGTSTFNMVNGNLSLSSRVNVGNGTATAILNVSGGTLTVNSPLGGMSIADNVASTVGTVNATAGSITIIGNSLFVTSRGTGTLNMSGSAQITAGNMDLCRVAAAGSKGTVNLNGGTLTISTINTGTQNNVPTNGTETAIINFNGGTLKAKANASAWIATGRGGTNPVPQLIVKSGGAVIDSAGFNVTVMPAFLHDSSLGGTADGGLTKNSSGTLTLTNANTYTGKTIVNAGTLALSGAGSIANSPAIVVAGGATLDTSGASLTFASGQILSNTTSTATLNGSADITAGSLGLNYGSGTASFTLTSGTLNLGTGTTVTVKNTGSALAAGTYTLISNTGGSVGGTAPSSVTVTGGGIAGGNSASLQISGGGELNLVVASASFNGRLSGIGVSGTTLSINATNGPAGGSVYLLESTNMATPLAQWKTNRTVFFDGTGHLSTNIVNVATNAQTFYILKQ